ncbi:MAG: PEP-CTERM sorting domain-containing protein, partial [Phycisphaerales bacterium]|nr:PEP-CTERM sorting domain-containing protein [Phycisphaerales bacterium]
TGTDAGQFVSAHLGINTFGPKCVLVDGSGATLETSINLGAATWYKVEFSWTPTTETTDEATGAFSYTVNSTGGSTVGTLTTTTEVTLDSSDVYFGFGGAQPSAYGPTGATFDNISITGHTPAPTTMLWQTDVIGNWTSENWTTDDGETYVVPVAGLGMFVNSGKVTVAAAPVETPLSLDVAMAGTVEVASAASLTVTEAVNVGDGGTLAMGGGSKILSSAAVPLDGDATITVAGTLAGASDDTSAFGDMGNDGGTVNLTLTGDSTYEVTCVGALDDDDNPIVVDTSIDVTGKLTMEAGATIDLNLGAGDITNGTVMLFRTYYDEFDIDGVVFDLDDPDNPSDLAAAGINLTSNGEALVGATLAWSEYIYDEPLDAEFIYLTLTGVTLINDTVLGDANGDKVVNETDLNFLLAQFGSAYDLSLTADFNDDGYVDLADFVILRAHWGDGAAAPDASVLPTATPEPATLIFLAAGLPALLKRRRRRS